MYTTRFPCYYSLYPVDSPVVSTDKSMRRSWPMLCISIVIGRVRPHADGEENIDHRLQSKHTDQRYPYIDESMTSVDVLRQRVRRSVHRRPSSLSTDPCVVRAPHQPRAALTSRSALFLVWPPRTRKLRLKTGWSSCTRRVCCVGKGEAGGS